MNKISPALIIRLVPGGSLIYSKCISCSSRVLFNDGQYQCKNGHLNSTKSYEFYLELLIINLHSLKISKKCLFSKNVEQTLGFTAPEWIKSLEACPDKKHLRNRITNALSDLLTGQIAFIKFKSSIIIDFKLLSFNTQIKPFLSGTETFISDLNFTVLDIKSKHQTAKDLINEECSIGERLHYINWEEWFSISDDEYFSSVDDDVLIKEMLRLEIQEEKF